MEKEIWLNIITGDKEAYSTLYVFYFKKLFNYGRKFTVDEVFIEDAIQEVMLQLWTKRTTLSSIRFPETYLFSSFRYTLFRKIKSAQKIHELPESQDAEPDFALDHFIAGEAGDALHQQLQQALQKLTGRQREAIFLRFYEGLSYEEVAGVLNISVKATYKIMARALLQLREQLPVSLLTMLVLLRNLSL